MSEPPLNSEPADDGCLPELGGLRARDLFYEEIAEVAGPSDWQVPSLEAVAELLPEYRIASLLGHGGMGAVYKATQKELEREVAIKLLPPEWTHDWEFAQRFQREARVLASLQHPNIVTVYTSGQTAQGHLYFVMEYVDGMDLSKLTTGVKLEPGKALSFALQVCNALQYAHERGVVHRDIKPANILIEREERVKLVDFGLAKPLMQDISQLTRPHVAVGTLDYMAPEQRKGTSDTRTDIYATGVTLYEMLTGSSPTGAFLLPSKIVKVDRRIDSIIHRSLQPLPADRFQSAVEMRAALERVLSPQRSAWQRFGLTLCSALVLALAIGSWSMSASWMKPKADAPRVREGADSDSALRRLADASAANPYVNSLGMKFVSVPGTGTLFCIHATRRRDYAAYASVNPGNDTSWKHQVRDGIPVGAGDEHPVVAVNCHDARAFCDWLSKKEGLHYRLPTDHEYSCAMGIGDLEIASRSPVQKRKALGLIYPWGTQWPPPPGSGNFADSSMKAVFARYESIPGYTDGFITTAPVMSFRPNELGLYDMVGNAWQWCEDVYDSTASKETVRTIRGSGWTTTGNISLSDRGSRDASARSDLQGFRPVIELPVGTYRMKPPARLVKENRNYTPNKAPLGLPPSPCSNPADASKDHPFVNHLGLWFVPIPHTQCLFATTVVRIKDFRKFVEATHFTMGRGQFVDEIIRPEVGTWEHTGFPQDDEYPVVNVSWKGAKAFCEWLSKEENRHYRLPTDREWSWAVGIAELEDAAAPPSQMRQDIPGRYAWGSEWPPPPGSGNIADLSLKEKYPAWPVKILGEIWDGYPATSQVTAFKVNELGLYDMGGNVRQWCEDLVDSPPPNRRVVRGSSWVANGMDYLLASERSYLTEDTCQVFGGMRCIIDLSN